MNGFQELTENLAEQIAKITLSKIRAKMPKSTEPIKEFVYSESRAAEKLGVSKQYLEKLRKDGEIDHTYVIKPTKWDTATGKPLNGRPGYLAHHLFGYLLRHEVKNGKQPISLTDALGSNVVEFRNKEAA